MATKEVGIFLKTNYSSNDENYQLSNFKLNQSHKCSDFLFSSSSDQSYSKSKNVKNQEYTVTNHFQENEKSWNKSTSKDSTLKTSKNPSLNEKDGDVQKRRINEKKNSSNPIRSSSTLSLHIAAYENSVENSSDESGIDWIKSSKTFEPNSTNFQDTFEFPRQQEGGNKKSKKSEVQQFKASQKLLSPKQSPSSGQMQVSRKKKIHPEISEEDWRFEKFRAEKLDAYEKELKQLEACQDELKELVEKTFNEEDFATLLMQSLLRMVEEVPDILKAKASGVDETEESVHKTHVQNIRDISEEIDRIRDQCRDIHSQIKLQKEELHKGDGMVFSRSIYIILAFIADSFISIILFIVWIFESLTGIKVPRKLQNISKWPTSMLSFQLKKPLTIPTRTVSAAAASSNPSKLSRQQQQRK